MATRGSKKALSVEHEEYIAKVYEGIRSPSSGAAVTDSGDVKTKKELFECKLTGAPGKVCDEHGEIDCKECLRTPTLVQHMEKVADEAYEVGKEPAVALRYYAPHSKLAGYGGWVDLTVRLTLDDHGRTEQLAYLEGLNS
jgi:hypothetical protein